MLMVWPNCRFINVPLGMIHVSCTDVKYVGGSDTVYAQNIFLKKEHYPRFQDCYNEERSFNNA